MSLSSQWELVTQEDAQQHTLYGVRGWLLVFAVGLVLSSLKLTGEVFTLENAVGASMPAVRYMRVMQWGQICMTAVILWMMASKFQFFRVVTTSLLLVAFPFSVLVALANPFEGASGIIGQSFLFWVISSSVWVTYLQRSRRVRVTFESRVRRIDQVLLPTREQEVGRDPEPQLKPGAPLSTMASVPAPTLEKLSPNIDAHWAQALDEFEGVSRKSGLWARSYVQAGGDDAKTKVIYLSERVQELVSEQQAKLHEKTVQTKKKKEAERLATMSEAERVWELTPKGTCPNCSKVIALDSAECTSCRAVFGIGSAWAVEHMHGAEGRAKHGD